MTSSKRTREEEQSGQAQGIRYWALGPGTMRMEVLADEITQWARVREEQRAWAEPTPDISMEGRTLTWKTSCVSDIVPGVSRVFHWISSNSPE